MAAAPSAVERVYQLRSLQRQQVQLLVLLQMIQEAAELLPASRAAVVAQMPMLLREQVQVPLLLPATALAASKVSRSESVWEKSV